MKGCAIGNRVYLSNGDNGKRARLSPWYVPLPPLFKALPSIPRIRKRVRKMLRLILSKHQRSRMLCWWSSCSHCRIVGAKSEGRQQNHRAYSRCAIQETASKPRMLSYADDSVRDCSLFVSILRNTSVVIRHSPTRTNTHLSATLQIRCSLHAIDSAQSFPL